MSCVFCGADASEKIVFPDTFTAYQMLQAGDKACKQCKIMFTDGKYRRKCYYIKNGIFAEIIDVLGFLYAMPKPPFVMYFTKAKRKHGWINAVQNPVLNLNHFILCVDEDKIFFDRARFTGYLTFIGELWDREIPKSVMLNGYPSASIIRKYHLVRKECLRLKELQSDRLWQFIVAFKKREAAKQE